MKRLIEQMPVLSESETKREEKWETVNFSDIAEQNAPVTESVAYEKISVIWRIFVPRCLYAAVPIPSDALSLRSLITR